MSNVKANSILAETITSPVLTVKAGMSAPDIDNHGTSVKDLINTAEAEQEEHIANTTIHLTSELHTNMDTILSKFSFTDTDVIPLVSTPFNLPDGSIKWQRIQDLFASECQPSTYKAPGRVYVARVPYSTIKTNEDGTTTWAHIWSKLSQGSDVYAGLNAKLIDNLGLEHAGSTDTVEGVDDYVGKEWAFWWGHCNYTKDEFGQKHITAFKDLSLTGHVFDEKKNTGAFGPKFWFFCKPEKSKQVINGVEQWTTDTGEKDGQPFTQLWGISDSRWTDLDDTRRNALLDLGITPGDFHIWPECLVWDKVQNAYVERPYWIHSAYPGGWGYDDITGQPTLVSKKNAVMRRNMSYQNVNAIYGAAVNDKYPGLGCGGSACVNGFVTLFDVVKNGSRFTQESTVHNGMSYVYYDAYPVHTDSGTATAGYIFPIKAAGTSISASHFTVGATVYLRTAETAGNQSNIENIDRSVSFQVGRIAAIEDRTFMRTTSGGSTEEITAKCIVLDPTTVEPFRACTTYDEAKSLNDSGGYASNYIIVGFGMGGITDYVIGKHDGQCYTTASSMHTCRTQGTEFMAGAWQVAADTVAIVGDGTEIEIDGITYTPGTDYKVILQCPVPVNRHRSYSVVDGKVSIQTWLGYGYKPIGLQPNVPTHAYISNMGLTASGVLLTTPGNLVTTNNMNSANGPGDYFYNNPSSQHAWEYLSGGHLSGGSTAGSACLVLNDGLGTASWTFCARA